MKTRSIVIAMLLCLANVSYSQTVDDIGKIVLGVRFLNDVSQETRDLQQQLEDKLIMFASQSGCSSFSNSTFFISPNVVVNGVDMAGGGMKNVYVVQGELYLSIQDDVSGTVYSSASFPFKGSATKKDAALKNAVLNINYNKVQKLFVDAKNKICAHYEGKKAAIFAHADMCVANGNYDEAIACLMMIPEELGDMHIQATAKAQDIFAIRDEAMRQQYLAETYSDNEGIIKEANSLLAMHDAQGALRVLWNYRSMDERQDSQYSALLRKAENLVTQAEREALRKEERAYRDSKAREAREWKEYTAQTAHERDMDRKNMKLKSQIVSSAECVAHHQTEVNSQRIKALKTIACEYIRNNPNSYIRVNF